MRPLLALATLALILISPLAVRPAHAQPGPSAPALAAMPAPFAVERFVLPNGLQVWVQPRADSQSVVAMLVFRAGARYERPEEGGISHFVEHMLFTGTERWGEDVVKSTIAKRGGRWNGWTSYERTTYFAQVAAQDTPVALDWLAEIAFRSTFPADKIDKERQVIFQEKSGRYGGFVNALDEMGFGYELERDVRRALYPGSTLGQRVIGEDASLDAIGRAELLAYYQAHYTPSNATLIVVGRVEPEQIGALAERYFAGFAAGERVAPPAAAPATPPGPHRVTVRGPLLTDQTILMLGARSVGRSHPDRYALDVLGELLRAELTEEIRYRRGLVYGLRASNSAYDDTGYFVIETSAAGERRAEIIRLIRDRLASLRAGAIDPLRVEEARAAVAGRWALAMEDNVKRAEYLADWSSLLEPGAPLPDYAGVVGQVTAADVVRVAATYFVPATSFEGAHVPAVTVAGGSLWLGALAALGALAWAWRRLRRRGYAGPLRSITPLSRRERGAEG